jgi:Skp family chaperone for outer membrane proteins
MTPTPTAPATQNLSYASAVASSASTGQNGASSSTSTNSPVPPPGGWDQLWSLLNTMNDGIKSLQSSATALNAGLDKNTSELASFKTEIGARVESLEKKYDELSEEVERRLEEHKEEVRTEIADQVERKLSEWKEAIKSEVVAELKLAVGEGSVSLNPPNLPNTTIAQKFQHLLRLSRSLESNFCMGPTKHKAPTQRAVSVLRQFFPEFDFSFAGKSGASLVRFSVPTKRSAEFRAKLQEVRGAILTYGWWVAQENPSDLRAMYTLTNDFLKFAKSNKIELKAFFLTIECGWVFFRDLPIFPVFLVPADSSEWAVLSGLLLGKLKNSVGVDWLSRVAENPKPDTAFLGNWLEAMKLKKDLANALVPLFSSQDEEDEAMLDNETGPIQG